MATQSQMTKEMTAAFTKLQQESASLEKEEGAAKARIDALQQQVQCAQETLFENQRKVRKLDMHLEAYKSLQDSQNELLESLEEKRNAVSVDCDSKQRVLDKLTTEIEEVKELAFVPEAYADLIESLRTCRLSNTGEDQSAFDAEANSVREKRKSKPFFFSGLRLRLVSGVEQERWLPLKSEVVVCHNEINNLRGEMSALDEDLRKIKFLDIAVEDMKTVLKSIRAEASKLNTKLIEYQLRRHRLEANGVLRSFE
ncbi:hypothetical protein Tcan_13181 [Toxocara canis]|uniref:Uncharacterized protein n=1 Tax=Toxocara canis TaxID=6265 RepID=A0A0B2VYR3_TOXCA|nr:hypothetical protein Tcan_13181 [Toxocara canis]